MVLFKVRCLAVGQGPGAAAGIEGVAEASKAQTREESAVPEQPVWN